MGFDDICNTGLVLGLGFSSSTAEKNHHRKPKGVINYEPSLTLSLSGETYKKIDESAVGVCILDHQSNDHDNLLCRQDSAASSFSNVSVKRERDHHILLSSEDVETTMDRVVSRVISTTTDDDEDGTNARKKLRLTKAQSAFLEESFKLHSTLNPKQKQDLAKELKLRPRQVEVWFQNRRARTKLKQTEVDCEFLKKCCETLTDENRRLQKELQELKSLKLAQPFYMQLPAATLTMCPSCERIGGVNENAATSKKPPQLFNNPFANQSAAC